MNLNKKEEGKLEQIPDSEQVVVKVDNEVPKKLDKIEKDDKQSFEDFKNLYKGVIDMKCNQDYGTIEDKDLWEDCAKELFLKSKTYLLKGNEYKAEPIQKKTESRKVESANEYNTIPEIKERLKEINKQLSYIKRRDAVSLSIGTEEEQEELYSERAKLNGKLRKLRNDAVNINKLNPSDQAKLKDRLKDLHLWDGKDDTLQSALQTYRNHYIQQFEDKKIDHNIDSYKSGDVVDILGSYGKWLNSSDRIKYVIDRPATKEEIEGIWDINTPCYIVKTIGMTDDTKFLNGTSKEPITRLRHSNSNTPVTESLDNYQIRKYPNEDEFKGTWGLYDLKQNKFIQKGPKYLMKAALKDYTSKSIKKESEINRDLNNIAQQLFVFDDYYIELVRQYKNKDDFINENIDLIKDIKDEYNLTYTEAYKVLDKIYDLSIHNKSNINESYYIKLFNKDNTDIDTIETSTEQEAIKTAEEKMKEGWRAVVYNADNKEALYDYDPFEELEESLQEEEITPANIKEKALEILPKEDVDVKDSDLYIKVSDKSKELINKLQFKNNGLLTTFRSPIDNEMWYDIPFANLDDYITSKTESNNNTYYYDIHIVEDDATGMGYSVFIKTTKHYDEDLDADAIVDEAIKQNKLDADEADYCDYVSEISEQEYKDAVPHTENELVNVGDKFINQNGAMITILEPTKNNEVQFKVTNTKTGEEGTDVYITSSIDKILKDNGYIKVEENKLQENNTDLEYKYMLLDRLKQDCEYFLGNGNGNAEHSLWAKDIDKQIEKMKEIYNSFSEEEKPDWITLEDINNYEKRMKEYNKDVKTENLSDKDKFLVHILNGVVKDIQSRFDVEATAEFTKDEDEMVIYIRGNTLDLIDATSYLAKTIRRDDVDFEFDENITDNTIKCYIAPKNLNESKVEESVVSDYTLSEIKKVMDSDGNDFTMKISNSNINVETKYLDIDREDLISIYNVLGGNKDELTESRPDKDRARAAAFAGSRRRLQLPATGLNEEAEIIEYLEKCKNQIDIMNVNNAIKNTELRNKLLTTGFDFAKSVNIVDDHIDEFKNAMIKATQDYFQNIKTESREGYQDKCCMCGTSNLNGCYSVLDEEGNVGSVCIDCGKKYSLPEIEKKINSDMKSEYMNILKDAIRQGKLTEADSYKDPELMKRYNITKIYNSKSEVPYEIVKYKFGTERYVSLEHYNKLLNYCKNLIDLDVIDQHCANSVWDTSFKSEAVTLTNSFYLNEIAKEYKIKTRIILQLELEHTELFLEEHALLGGNLIYFYKPSFVEVKIEAGSASSFMPGDKLRYYEKFNLDQLNNMKSFIISENKRIASNVDPDDNHNRASEEHAEAIAHNTLYNN